MPSGQNYGVEKTKRLGASRGHCETQAATWSQVIIRGRSNSLPTSLNRQLCRIQNSRDYPNDYSRRCSCQIARRPRPVPQLCLRPTRRSPQ
ncbi:hypothetical protein AVEN_171578-1 [Araneus ventricosus]|uniref:Uncharacterized protein n=1 Tax=Araneus ventricosus TaxID=182803 RepID=A0A4Y2M9G4_ARAVE|nr:hypothetical protein AVEN_171578-1 [Araneus ventricosus]